MIISESQLRKIIREELLKEGIISESDLLEEGIMDSLKKAAKTIALSASLASGLAACGASQQQANHIARRARNPHSISAAIQRVKDRQASGETTGDVERTPGGYRTTQRDNSIFRAIGDDFKANEELIEMMAAAFRNQRLRSNPSSEQEVTEADRVRARGFIIMKIDEAASTGDYRKVQEMGNNLFRFARDRSR